MYNPAQNATRTTKQIAVEVARRAVSEPIEILKQGTDQVFGAPPEIASDQPSSQDKANDSSQTQSVNEQPKNELDLQTIRKLEAEAEQIRKDNVYKDLVRRVQNGEDVSLVDVTDLTPEQKQVLAAQMEAMKQRQQAQSQQQGVAQSASKPSRRLFHFGQKQAAERQSTHVERPVPPSG